MGTNKKNNNKKFQAVDISFWDQIQQTIQHEKLLNNNKDSSKLETNTDNNIVSLLDDSKIYKYMLQEYLSSGSTTRTTSSSSSIGKLKKQKGNKNKVDRKASKGRKIRYVTHTKLENFTFPIHRKEPIISEDEWFQSLFGGNRK